jgi:hypothetical protein
MELLAVAEPGSGAKGSRRCSAISIAGFSAARGLSFMMLKADVPADAAQFRASNIARSDALTFERAGGGRTAAQ